MYCSSVSMDFFKCGLRTILLQLDGNSHVIYAEEEAAGTRLLIDGRTCLLQVPPVLFFPTTFQLFFLLISLKNTALGRVIIIQIFVVSRTIMIHLS